MRVLLFALLCGVAIALFTPLSSARACGPGGPLSAKEMIAFQTGIIDRGLVREALSEAQRTEITDLRAQVVAAQNADRRAEARAAMQKIVAMFKQKEMMGAVEPIVPGCGPMRPTVVAGTLTGIEIEPNRPGARCGNHYVLTVAEVPSGKAIKLTVYDVGKAPYAKLEAMLRRTVEIDTMGSSVIGIRLADPKGNATAALAGLSAVKPC